MQNGSVITLKVLVVFEIKLVAKTLVFITGKFMKEFKKLNSLRSTLKLNISNLISTKLFNPFINFSVIITELSYYEFQFRNYETFL